MDAGTLIALDWGTSALRAALIDAGGRVLERRDAPAGVQAIAGGRFRETFESVCGDWLDAAGARPVIAAGMIGSRQGWREAPYVEAPAGFDALAGALLRIDAAAGRRFAIVPGVSGTLPAGTRDVMRGEETQVFGALAAEGLADATVLLPGTHSKWVEVRGRRIVSLRTYLTGELYAVLAAHSILGRLFPPAGSADAERFATHAFDEGLARARADPSGLTALLFSVRAEGLFGRFAADALPSYLSGLLIGAELAHALGDAHGASGRPGPLLVVGAAQLERRYLHALARAGAAARPGPRDAAFAGLHALAVRAGLLPDPGRSAPPA